MTQRHFSTIPISKSFVEFIGGCIPAKEIILEALQKGKDVRRQTRCFWPCTAPRLFSQARRYGKSISLRRASAAHSDYCRAADGFIANRDSICVRHCKRHDKLHFNQDDQRGRKVQRRPRRGAKMGYAEKDPTMDVEGDARRTSLPYWQRSAFGVDFDYDAFITKASARWRFPTSGTLMSLDIP